ncbi:hypothetical protein [Bradyrhizobium sp. B117]|uniref:hypothetical protein n=1 Tax=Bradyrhizobium sp. B117 TaxID=3140246 RepID=UPI0031832935
MTSDIRDLLVSDPTTLPLIIGLLKADPPPSVDLQRAIGSGLGLAANMCIRPDPAFAAEIQTQLVATNSTDAKQQYAAITGNQLIGTVGGGGGGISAGASGGQVNPLGNNPSSSGALQTFVSNSVTNPNNNFFGGSTGSAGSITNNTTTSVSPSTP